MAPADVPAGRARLPGNPCPHYGVWFRNQSRIDVMRAILLWVLGIPIPILILLYLFHVI